MHLKEEMLLYAEKHLRKDDLFEAFLSDTDLEFQRIAYRNGYLPTTNKECDAYFPIEERSLDYTKGFDHEEGNSTFTASQKDIEQYHYEFNAPNVNKELKIIVLDPKGEFAAYCGMWYDETSEYGIVEPLVTIPRYRKMGLGKAVVYGSAAPMWREI